MVKKNQAKKLLADEIRVQESIRKAKEAYEKQKNSPKSSINTDH